jgi:hypothetical protein
MFPLNRLSILLKPGVNRGMPLFQYQYSRYISQSRRRGSYYRSVGRGSQGKRRHHHPDSWGEV